MMLICAWWLAGFFNSRGLLQWQSLAIASSSKSHPSHIHKGTFMCSGLWYPFFSWIVVSVNVISHSKSQNPVSFRIWGSGSLPDLWIR